MKNAMNIKKKQKWKQINNRQKRFRTERGEYIPGTKDPYPDRLEKEKKNLRLTHLLKNQTYN